MLKLASTLLSLAVLTALVGCATVPFTGRTQWSMVNRAALNQAVDSAYESIKDSLPPPKDPAQAARLQRVGQRMVQATELFLRRHQLERSLEGVRWVFLTEEDSATNAGAFPGGKIFVTTGMLRTCASDTLLACVIGHEMGHVLAAHTAESYSKYVVNVVGMAAVTAVDVSQRNKVSATDTTRLLDTYKSLQQLGGFAHSRKQEREADRIGMILMALAAYPPAAQVTLWERIGQQEPGSYFALDNTHPTHGRRVRLARQQLPEALRYWQGAPLVRSVLPAASTQER